MRANLPYIITGVVALIVTVYLFAALLFPEMGSKPVVLNSSASSSLWIAVAIGTGVVPRRLHGQGLQGRAHFHEPCTTPDRARLLLADGGEGGRGADLDPIHVWRS